jgi:hypothetical protein
MIPATEYTVTWTIDLLATSAQDAAAEALAIQRDPLSTATVFTVTSFDREGAYEPDIEIIDLLDFSDEA